MLPGSHPISEPYLIKPAQEVTAGWVLINTVWPSEVGQGSNSCDSTCNHRQFRQERAGDDATAALGNSESPRKEIRVEAAARTPRF